MKSVIRNKQQKLAQRKEHLKQYPTPASALLFSPVFSQRKRMPSPTHSACEGTSISSGVRDKEHS